MIHLFRRGWMLYNCKRHYESLGFKQGGLLTIKQLKTNTSHHTKVESRWCVCLLLCSFSFLNVVFCFMHFKNWIIPIYLSFFTQCLYDFQLIYSTPLSSALYVSLTLCCFSASLAFPLLFYVVLNYFHFFNLSVFCFFSGVQTISAWKYMLATFPASMCLLFSYALSFFSSSFLHFCCA